MINHNNRQIKNGKSTNDLLFTRNMPNTQLPNIALCQHNDQYITCFTQSDSVKERSGVHFVCRTSIMASAYDKEIRNFSTH